MKYETEMFKKELEAAGGLREADLLLENVRLVDVYTNEIYSASIAIFNGKIVAINPKSPFQAKERTDCGGLYAVPGFMDAHVHIETTLLTTEALGDVIVPWGTTSLFVDAMEIANVAGMEGLLAFFKDPEKLPYRIFLEVPSRVPTAPGLETTGGVLGLEEVETLLGLEQAVSLGELDPSKVLGMRDEYLNKIQCALKAGKICNGHAIGLSSEQLNVYATGHLADDHESVTYEELLARLRVGIKALVREGSSERNADALMKGVIQNGLPTENLLFCTDDKHVNDIFTEGHISYNIQRSIDLGLDPVAAIKIATINTAKHFRKEHDLGSLTPGRFADIVLLEDLRVIRPVKVYKSGRLVSENGKVIPCEAKAYPEKLYHTVHIPAGLSPGSFAVLSKGSRARVRVISLISEQIINKEIQEWMTVQDGLIQPDVKRDILKLAVVERYGKNGRTSAAFAQGFGLQHGAMASSVSHDHHNIVVIGTNDEDMCFAVQEVARLQGGFVAVSDGRVVDEVALPLAGLVSRLSAMEMLDTMSRLNESVRQMGCTMSAPFMALSFISLPTVPDLGLTDYGLVDVMGHKLTNLILDTE